MDMLLDPSICINFRNVINKSPIFVYDETYKVHYNLFCAVMDRLDTSIGYINNHLEHPKTEEDFLSFLMFSCMVTDGVKLVLKNLKIQSDFFDEKKVESKKFFKDICIGSPLDLSEEECPADDKFFEYFRSVAFAHPFDTNRPKFFKEKETQYSPWVIANRRIMGLRGISDGIGVRLYSNTFDGVQDLIFSFDILKKYLCSRYEQLEKATSRLNQILLDKENQWRKQKVNRNLSPTDTLKELTSVQQSRYESTLSLDTAILYLECKHTKPENSEAISAYREAIIKNISDLCDATDSLDYEKLEDILSGILRADPKKMYPSANYHLEKIYTYLTDYSGESNVAYGKEQAALFSKEFARKWVTITPEEMSYAEIQLLVSAACYLEKENQEKELSL